MNSSPRILLIHHAKNFESNDIYLSDDYFAASAALFGAQEMDTWAGYRFLDKFADVYRLQISHNLKKFQLIRGPEILFEAQLPDLSSRRKILSPEYLYALFKYCDTTLALNSSFFLRNMIKDFVKSLNISLIWTDTQFYDQLLPDNVPNVTRSVNFEPYHVLREDPSFLRYLRYFSKMYSEKKILKQRTLLSISPRDSVFYSRLARRNISVLPLRQLPFLIDSAQRDSMRSFSSQFDFRYFHFAGSNFDVKHNRDNLVILLNKIAPELMAQDSGVKILVFGHRFPEDLICPPNVRYMHFRDDFHSIARLSMGAIVPSPGGAGMQSKIFEPLSMGVPLVADPLALAGYPFVVNHDFLDASSSPKLSHSLKLVLRNQIDISELTNSAMRKTEFLFNMEVTSHMIREIVNAAIN